MAFREDLKEWWNDPLKFRSRRSPNAGVGRMPTMREWFWTLVGIGLVGAVKDYIFGQSWGFIISLDLTFTLAGLIGLTFMWWKDRQTKQ